MPIKYSPFDRSKQVEVDLTRAEEQPRWVVIANMGPDQRAGRVPGQVYQGTRVFRAGAKLYMGESYAGRWDSTRAIGLPRNTARMVNCAVKIGILTQFRAKLEYSPNVLKRLGKLDAAFFRSGEEARRYAELLEHVGWLYFGKKRGRPRPACTEEFAD